MSPTLQVEEGAGVGGFLRGSLGDGQQIGAVALQDGRHEAQEGLLDLQLQLLLPPVDQVVVRQQELQRGLLLAWRADCTTQPGGQTTGTFKYCDLTSIC